MKPGRPMRESSRAQQCGVLLLAACMGCSNEVLLVGMCEGPASSSAVGEGADAGSPSTDITLPWASGFEAGFCDFRRVGGHCYARGNASYTLVTSPVRSATFAAAFTVTSNNTGTQARCGREGNLPKSAYYGAWFYVSPARIEKGNWELVKFEGRSTDTSETPHGLWGVELSQASDGQHRLSVYDFLHGRLLSTSGPPIPIESWFHVVVYLSRASDETGQLTLIQDGSTVLELTALETDDSQWGLWWVGNYGPNLSPAQTTVYVDDVTIDATM